VVQVTGIESDGVMANDMMREELVLEITLQPSGLFGFGFIDIEV
jgi:hypothetical protein